MSDPMIAELVASQMGGGSGDEMAAPAEMPAEAAADPLEAAAGDFIAATQAGDAAGVAAAFRMMFGAMEMAGVEG